MTTIRSTSQHTRDAAKRHKPAAENIMDEQDDEIRYAIATSTLGLVLIARSAAGICAVLIGDNRKELALELRKRFPLSALKSEDAEVSEMRPIMEAIDSGAPEPKVPLDIRGTSFQRRVWDALRNIPSGSTASYGEIARQMGMPAAARAIARACAANPLAVIVPCHRVIASDGRISGYHWGIERKRALLERERIA